MLHHDALNYPAPNQISSKTNKRAQLPARYILKYDKTGFSNFSVATSNIWSETSTKKSKKKTWKRPGKCCWRKCFTVNILSFNYTGARPLRQTSLYTIIEIDNCQR